MKNLVTNILWIFKRCRSCIKYIILITIIGSLASLLTVGKALATKYLINSAVSGNSSSSYKWMLILGLFLMLSIILSSLLSITSTYASEKTKNILQEKLYIHIINSTWKEHCKYHSVELLTRITNDVNTITTMLINTIPKIISLFVMLITSFFALLSISPTISIIAIALLPFLILLSKLYGRKLKYFYKAIQQKETDYNRFMQESFNNILIVKTFCLELSKIRSLQNVQNSKLNLSIKKSYFSSASNAFLSLSSYIGYFIVLGWGALNLSSNVGSAFGNLTAMLQLFSSVQAPIYELSSSFPQLVSALAASERLAEIESMNLERPLDALTDNNSISDYSDDEIATTLSTDISFRDVSFSYDEDSKILSDVSLKINPGEIIGLIGPSGEGKTTLIRLILSLIFPTSGEIKINNENLKIVHRNLISYVPQGNTLFSGTILENLKLGDDSAQIAEIDEALKMSCAYDFVNTLPNNINTIIGERGLGISEGQAQRLAIARAFLRKRPILILDEATSSLDPETELKVLNSIKNLPYNPICIIITHRPSALSICDKVYKLKDKHLIEQHLTI